MKLYQVGRSPFAARVRAVIYHKGIDLPFVEPPAEGVKSAEYLQINPLGKVPTLVLEDGAALPESEVIIEYLEQRHPTPPIHPADPKLRARARLLARAAELYVMGPLFQLFAQMVPGNRNEAVVEACFAGMKYGLDYLEGELPARAGFAVGDAMTVADCMLVPTAFWVEEIHKRFARPSPLANYPKLSAYIAAMRAQPVFARIWQEMGDDLAALMAARAKAAAG